MLAVRDGKEWRYAGRVGTGFTRAVLEELHGKLLRLRTPSSPFKERVKDEAVTTWVKPKLVAEMKFTEWTTGGEMRHPVFLGLREDKRPEEAVREKEKAVGAGEAHSPTRRPRQRCSSRSRTWCSGCSSTEELMRRPLLVIDGNSFAHRAYHALPKTIRRRGNKGAGAILGFANILLRLYDVEKPRAVLVGWDSLDEPTYRHEALESYQAGRVFDDELIEQLEVLPEFVAACGFGCAKAAGYEADDFLAAAVAREERRGGTTVVATGDRDAYQLASVRTTILQPVRAGEMARIGPDQVRERYGVEPAQVPDFIALRGDASDKIPGAAGIGAIGAARLLRKYGSLESAIAAGRFAAQADKLRMYRSIATMDKSAPIPPLRNRKPTWRAASRMARGWQLNKLADRLDTLATS